MITSYKTEIKPNRSQVALFNKALGIYRFAYNWALNGCINSYENNDKIFEPNAIKLHKLLVSKKQTEFPWMYEVSKCVPQFALRHLEQSYKNFFKKKSKFPKFKKKGLVNSFKLDGSVYSDGKFIHLPSFGKVKLKEKDYVPFDKFKSVTVSTKAGRWFVSVNYEINIDLPKNESNEIIGIDLGIKSLAVLSSGEKFSSPDKLKKNEQRLKRYQRKFARQKIKSNNRNKTRLKIQKIYFDISNQRKDILHKLTSFVVKTKRPKTIVIEDLNITGMKKNHNLAKAISNIGFFEIRRQLEYKSKIYGVDIIIADRWFPSSKMCSGCGQYKSNLLLSDRIYNCDCGVSIDRDMNAAINLRNYAMSSMVHACAIASKV